MKKTLLLLTVFTLILSISVFSVSAETKSLLPTDVSKWKSVEAGGENATVAIKNGATVVSGSKTSWPSVAYSMGSAESIKVPIKGYAIEYDVKVEKGSSNIFIFMKGDTPDAPKDETTFKFMYIFDNCDPTSGDVTDGTYKGTITLEKMMQNKNFPAGVANSDNTITFSGLSIYSVVGANVTVNKFQIVEATGSTTSTASGTSSLTSSSAASSGNSNSVISSTSSAKNSSSAASSTKVSSSAPASSTSSDSNNNGIDSMWYYIIGGVAIVAIVAVVLIVTKKKK